ncbi:sensor histidine kinase [Actinomadura fibrosa]|uniref:histidine kinase n=1 Tax=Actinomadura fibrosa TaxID=111802 RepID=A0ABW2XSE9_9ACTN|nr:sensor histidine kinase [Actinomadura fibrosa]
MDTIASRDRLTRLADGAAPWMLGLLLSALVLVDYSAGRHARPRDLVIVLFAALAGVTAGTSRRRLWPLFAVTAAGTVLFSQWPGLIVASYYAATRLRRGIHIVAFTAAAAAGLAGMPLLNTALGTGFLLGPDPEVSAAERAFTGLLLVGTPLTVGLWIDARRAVIAGLAERARRLEREQVARAEQARAAERTRIAREMHDVVAHKVSLIVLHAGALEVNAPDAATETAAALIRTAGREALGDLRDVLGVLRAPRAPAEPPVPPPVLHDLDRLLRESRAAGLQVRRHVKGDARTLPSAAERAAYRVVQEALTNVHRHAAGAATQVTLHYHPHHLEVTVRNDPPAQHRADPLPGSGLGLTGLRERLDLAGGHLDADHDPDGGFTVRARIPA